MDAIQRIFYAAIVFVVILIAGTMGYMLLEGYTFNEALYMTVITITTIGFMEVHPLSETGRLFTILLAFGGVGFVLVSFGLLTQAIVEGQFVRVFGRRKVKQQIAKLKDHYIICGGGQIGHLLAVNLRKRGVRFVLIEKSLDNSQRLLEEGFLVMNGDAKDEQILEMANINTARGLIVALNTGSETVFTILTARELNPDLYIIARVNEVGTEKQIAKAGAHRVVSAFQTLSYQMLNAVIRPDVVDMLDLTLYSRETNLAMEGVKIDPKCEVAGKSILESNFRKEFNAMIVAIKKPDGSTVMGPGPKEIINGGDVLIVAGNSEDIERMADRFGG